eukprot:UN19884
MPLMYKEAAAQKNETQLEDLLKINLLNQEEMMILKNMQHKSQIVWIWMTSFYR